MSTIVAPNMLNRLEVVKPLRLMPSRGAAITVKQSWGIHRVQVPSNLGGTLVIGLGIDDLAPPPGTSTVSTTGSRPQNWPGTIVPVAASGYLRT